ncbi:MAG TPA: hypothetical protein VGL02_17460 [Streptomyces sp.]
MRTSVNWDRVEARCTSRPPPALSGLAQRAMRSLGLVFGSVDIVATDADTDTDTGTGSGSGLTVMEVNSGVCLERFSGQSEECYAAAERVYAAAVAACAG